MGYLILQLQLQVTLKPLRFARTRQLGFRIVRILRPRHLRVTLCVT